MKILILDNYDSFTYNLVHLIEKLSFLPFEVATNDGITLSRVAEFDKILLSPGPGLPASAGIMPQVLLKYAATKSILGVCLGMQAIGEAYGCSLKNLDTVFHGMATPIHIITPDPLFKNCPAQFNAGRYHSWVVDERTVHPPLQVTAVDGQGLIMGLRHTHYDVCGVQFHPESVLSEYGETILKNWLGKCD